MFKSYHGAATLVGLASSEPGAFDRHSHHLFLKQWHAQRLAEQGLKFGLGRDDILLALASPEIGMHRVTRIGPGRTIATPMTRS